MVGVLLGEEGDHIADSHLGGGLEVLIEAHRDVVGGGFTSGPEEMLIFMDDELEGSGELGLHGGDVDLSVALAGVAVAYLEEAAFGVDGDVEGGSSYHLFVVDVAGVHPGRCGVPLTGGLGRGDAHAAEEGMKRDVDAGAEVADHLVAIQRDEPGVAVGEVVREEAAACAEAVAGPGNVDVDLLDADFEDVTGFGFGDGDRTGEDVAAGAALCGREFGVDVVDVGGNVFGGDADGFEALARSAGREGLDGDGVAGVDGEDGLCFGGVGAPDDCSGAGEEGLWRLLGVRGERS